MFHGGCNTQIIEQLQPISFHEFRHFYYYSSYDSEAVNETKSLLQALANFFFAINTLIQKNGKEYMVFDAIHTFLRVLGEWMSESR